MTADEYRESHGLSRGQPLTSLGTAAALSAASSARVGTAGWQRMVAHRDPQAAAAARDFTVTAPAVRAGRGERAVDGRLPAREPRVRVCPHCGAEYTGPRKTCGRAECVRQCVADGHRRQIARRWPAIDHDTADALRRATGDALTAMVVGLQAAGFSSISLGRSPAWMTTHYPRP